jgi:hypothetical protein
LADVRAGVPVVGATPKIALYGPGSGAALATVVSVLVGVPVMLSVCRLMRTELARAVGHAPALRDSSVAGVVTRHAELVGKRR